MKSLRLQQTVDEIIATYGDLKWLKVVKPYEKADHRLAVLQILDTFVPFFVLYWLSIVLMGQGVWATVASVALSILLGFLTSRVFIIQHDAGHQSFFATRRMNNLVGTLCSIISGMPYDYWAAAHNYHHAHTGQLEVIDLGDIKTRTVENFEKFPRKKKIGYFLFRFPLITFLIIGPVYVMGYLRIEREKPIKGRSFAKSVHITTLALLVLYAGLTWLIGWEFLVVSLIRWYAFSVMAFWFFFVQHQHDDTFKYWWQEEKHKYRKRDLNLVSSFLGSSYYKLGWLANYLSGNIGLHHLHHLSARIPNYYLKKLQRDHPELSKWTTVVTFRESLKFMWNYLWDEKQGKMISFFDYYRWMRWLRFSS